VPSTADQLKLLWQSYSGYSAVARLAAGTASGPSPAPICRRILLCRPFPRACTEVPLWELLRSVTDTTECPLGQVKQPAGMYWHTQKLHRH
jgi:hypothetical protein